MGYPYSAQPVLVSGANIKTIGGESVLGSGDIDAVSSAALQAALADYSTTSQIVASFAPIVHTHAISAVTGLQTALNEKAAIVDLPAPTFIESGQTYIVRENQQVPFRFPIQVDGTLQVDGDLYEI